MFGEQQVSHEFLQQLALIIESNQTFEDKEMQISKMFTNTESPEIPVDSLVDMTNILADVFHASAKVRRIFLVFVIRSLVEAAEIPIEICQYIASWFRDVVSPDHLEDSYVKAIEAIASDDLPE